MVGYSSAHFDLKECQRLEMISMANGNYCFSLFLEIFQKTISDIFCKKILKALDNCKNCK